jgi:hypothetical protein
MDGMATNMDDRLVEFWLMSLRADAEHARRNARPLRRRGSTPATLRHAQAPAKARQRRPR